MKTILATPDKDSVLAGYRPLQQAMMDQSRLWWKAQMQALAAMERFHAGWMQRRRADLESALSVVERMGVSAELGVHAAAYHEWLSGCSQRAAQDMQSLSACMTSIAHEMSATTDTSGTERARSADRGPETVRRGAA